MPWVNLPTDYTDASWSGYRKYTMIQNDDGTVSFVDVTNYTNRENSFFGALNANQMNEAINNLMTSNFNIVNAVDGDSVIDVFIDGGRKTITFTNLANQINLPIKSNYVKNTDYATTSSPGIMTAADKTKLNGIATGANKTTVDTALSSTSTNPVQNKVVNTALNGKSNTNHTHNQYYSSDDNTSGTLTLSLAIGASGDYCTMADKAVEVTIVGSFAPTATGSATVTTIPFSFSKSKSFICHDMTNDVPLEATLSKTGELKVNFKSTGSQRIVLHETFIM